MAIQYFRGGVTHIFEENDFRIAENIFGFVYM